jgi:modulator of FtsH protease
MKTNHNLYTNKRSATAQTIAASNMPSPYILLSLTLLLPAVIIAASVAMKLPLAGIIVTLLAYFGLLFASAKMLGKGSIFANRNN